MGEVRIIEPVNLICAFFTSRMELQEEVKSRLENVFGPVDMTSEIYDFNFTRYYENEMGANLKKMFFSFQNLIEPGDLARIKITTNKIEKEFAGKYADVERPVNLDPGYISMGKLVLASVKNFSHRIYLGDGIFAEVTLYYEKEAFRSWPWTFPDYKSGLYDGFLDAVRRRYNSKRLAWREENL